MTNVAERRRRRGRRLNKMPQITLTAQFVPRADDGREVGMVTPPKLGQEMLKTLSERELT